MGYDAMGSVAVRKRPLRRSGLSAVGRQAGGSVWVALLVMKRSASAKRGKRHDVLRDPWPSFRRAVRVAGRMKIWHKHLNGGGQSECLTIRPIAGVCLGDG